MTGRRLAAVAAVMCALTVAVPGPASAAEPCRNPPAPSPPAAGVPAEAQIYAPKRLAPFATGRGVRVAVIDSGVDAGHPQLTGRVAKGADFLRDEPDGRQDCVGHGTAVASLIAARPSESTGFQGLAPDAVVVPVRISEELVIDGKATGQRGEPDQFAEAIDFAVEQGDAQVINLSLVMTEDNALVRRAVERALDAGVVVIAAAGNNGDARGGNPTPYPAAYDGVIGVGAVTPAGAHSGYSQRGDYVDLVAIGDGVTAAAGGAGNQVVSGTSFATPFVSATAALILQRFGELSPAEVARRLTATADPAPGGPDSAEYGAGLLNPYRAVTEALGPDTRPPAVAQMMSGDDPAAVARAARRAESRDRAVLFAVAGGGAVLLVGAAALIVRRGRRRGWAPARVTRPGAG
jgi:type VII secretion-associated serine protease mycosin